MTEIRSEEFAPLLGRVVSAALDEDHAATDLTTLWTVPAASLAEAWIICKQEGTLAGIDFVKEVFHQVDPGVRVRAVARDGEAVRPDDVVAVIHGRARSLITGERTALNLLQRAAGIATRTRVLVDELDGTRILLRDTRKTAPGLRQLDKYAVRCGGGSNHRMGLDDMILLKENHLRAAGGLKAAVRAVRENLASGEPGRLLIETEVTTLSEVVEGLDCEVDWLLLDNMSVTDMRSCRRTARRAWIVDAAGSFGEHRPGEHRSRVHHRSRRCRGGLGDAQRAGAGLQHARRVGGRNSHPDVVTRAAVSGEG